MNKFVFLDRDGVINKDPAGWTPHSYVTDWKYFRFLPGVLDALRILTERGYHIVIMSNQAGVGRGIYTKKKLNEITEMMLSKIKSKGGQVYAVFYCIHKREDNCDCRKPKTGLFKKAIGRHKIDFKKTYFIGDTERDIEAGKNIGCKTILVLSGKTPSKKEILNWKVKPDYIKKDLKESLSIL